MPAAAVRAAMGSPAGGLAAAEALSRRQRAGANLLPAAGRPGLPARGAAQFASTLILVLVASAAITALLGHWVDTLVILGVVVANAVIGLVQESRAERALAALRDLLAPQATVWRDGRRLTLPAADLVPGDLVRIEAGDRVPADLRLLEAHALLIDESVLTGESVAAAKDAAPVAAAAPLGDRRPMAFMGTMVARGTGTGIVTATGTATEVGRIGTLVAGVERLSTPLVAQMDRFGRDLTLVVLGFAAALLLWATAVAGHSFEAGFLTVVGLFVAAIPEGLPAVLTVALAIGVQAMARRRAVVRRLPARETLGALSVICTDKTGTLTRNEMAVTRLVTAAGSALIAGAGYGPEGRVEAVAGLPGTLTARAAAIAALCNDAHLVPAADGWRVEGDPMEGALLALAARLGGGPGGGSGGGGPARGATLPFDAAHRYMAVLVRGAAGGGTILVKGAPEALIARSTREARATGPAPVDRAFWERAAGEIAAAGARVLALAERAHEGEGLDHGDIAGLTLVGLVGMIDPARPEAAEAVALCRAAGIVVKMVTGDHAGTALAVARAVGIGRPGAALTGEAIDAMDDVALARAALATDVFARTSPTHKLRLVAALQAGGAVVAMTGDGVNDAPALRRADVGIAMGRKGSEAARAAADLVLTDDNFATIAEAVRQGRTVYANLRKVIALTLPTNAGEAAVITGAVLAGLVLPVTALQILWVNLVTETTLGLALAFEPPEPEVMRRPPRRRDAPILSPALLWQAALASVLFAVAVFGQFLLALERGASLETARTLAVNTLVALEIFYLFSVRYALGPAATRRGVAGTPAVLVAVAAVIALQALFTYLPPLQAAFGTSPLSAAELASCALAGAGLFVLLELDKWLARARKRRRG
ncbi:MAG: HAD-IC family P-type ATPase [Rhodobacteraceae bacterium]|nr:HAD-IC family P-type ATPase [Paracoccaceae bacterium]